eukprot:13660330-Alexandrium_andersonii.AAC.1
MSKSCWDTAPSRAWSTGRHCRASGPATLGSNGFATLAKARSGPLFTGSSPCSRGSCRCSKPPSCASTAPT